MINFKYCPQCKSDLNLSDKYPRCEACNITFFRNSKPCAGVLPIKNDKVLLSKRAIEPYKNAYDIIGGFLEEGEHPEDGAIREAKEETGLDVKINKQLGIYVDRYGENGDYTLNIHYLAEIVGGKMKPQEDVYSLHWLPITEVPIDEGFKNTQEALKDFKKLFTKKQKK